MPSNDYQGSFSPLASFGRSILSVGRDPVHSMDAAHDRAMASPAHDLQLDAFQRRVNDLFHGLAAAGGVSSEGVLSLPWLLKLLEAFMVCQEEFRAILLSHREAITRPPLDRVVVDSLERGLKALDVCNAVRDGIEQVRQWRSYLEIVQLALDHPKQRAIGEGHLRRARKALTELTIAMLDEKEGGSAISQRNRSFGKNNSGSGRDHHHRASGSPSRSLSWSVSRSWSASRQLQAIGGNLAAPRGNEIIATGGLAVPIYTMNTVLFFVMWCLVAAIPCQNRSLQIHFFAAKNYPWAAPMTSLHDCVMEESKKKDRRNSNGLLKEIHAIEKCSRQLAELIDPSQYPLAEDREVELRHWVEELSEICDSLKDGLEGLQHQLRLVFRLIIHSRMDGMDFLAQALK